MLINKRASAASNGAAMLEACVTRLEFTCSIPGSVLGDFYVTYICCLHAAVVGSI